MNRAFSKILILVIIIILVGGGIFALQYFRSSEEPKETKIPEGKITDQTAGWQTYWNEEYGFKIDYPHNATDVTHSTDFFEVFLTPESGTRLSEKVFTINVKEEEYDQPIEYYCAQGIPHSLITTFNDIDFCKSESMEDIEKNLAVRRFTYHIIHNKKWITLSLRLSSCVPLSPSDECSMLVAFDENEEKNNFDQILSTFRFLE